MISYCAGSHYVVIRSRKLVDLPPQRLCKRRVQAKPSKTEIQQVPKTAKESSKGSTTLLATDDRPNNTETWEWFQWDLYNKKWDVPWGGPTVVLGMVGWLVSSVAIGLLVIPQFMKFSGMTSMSDFSGFQKAELLLVVQTLETLVGLGVIGIATMPWKPSASLELFKLSFEKPFEKKNGWLTWALVGIVLSVGMNVAISLLFRILGKELAGPGTVEAVLKMVSLNPNTYFSLITVVGLLAPILEETVFRGFLLTSLTKWMPTYAAVIVSSVLFGCAHFSIKDFPYLTSVGAIWGFMYVRSRNLLTPIVMHSLWNSSVMTLLFILVAMGADLSQLL